jgi:glycosyltransferase involved in cell wall biosynthesis
VKIGMDKGDSSSSLARNGSLKVVHIATVDMSIRYLLLPQLLALKRSGFDVWSISSPGEHVSHIEKAGIPHVSVRMTRRLVSPVADARALLSLVALFRRERFDVVHTHTPKAGFLGRLAARVSKVPFILHTSHGFLFTATSSRTRRWFFGSLERLATHWSHLVFSVNQEDIQMALRMRFGEAEKFVFLGPGGIGVDLERFDPHGFGLEARKEIRAQLQISADDFVIGFVGRLVAEKGIAELLAALALLRKTFPRFRLLMVGPVDDEKRDRFDLGLVKRLGLDDLVVLTGLRDDMPAMYAAMDTVVLPSHREGSPQVLVEAASMGLPVIASDIRGCREIVIPGRTGVLVPLRSPRALSQAIVMIAEADAEQRASWSQNARRAAEELFDQRAVFQKMIRHYRILQHELSGRGSESANW